MEKYGDAEVAVPCGHTMFKAPVATKSVDHQNSTDDSLSHRCSVCDQPVKVPSRHEFAGAETYADGTILRPLMVADEKSEGFSFVNL